jgi:hypothetical protein
VHHRTYVCSFYFAIVAFDEVCTPIHIQFNQYDKGYEPEHELVRLPHGNQWKLCLFIAGADGYGRYEQIGYLEASATT